MATKRKIKRFAEGGSDEMSMEDARAQAGTPENESNAGMKEAYDSERGDAFGAEKQKFSNVKDFPASSGEAPARKKPAIVTKEQLAKSGFTNLRDYLNDQQHLKRRGEKATPSKAEFPEPARGNMENLGRPAKSTTSYETPYDRMNRENRESGRDFDSLIKRGVSALKERMSGDSGKDRLVTKRIDTSAQKGMGKAKGGAIRSASRRADGIAMRGKTKGRMV